MRRKVKAKQKKTPRTRKPMELSVGEWQIALRREFGREQKFKLENIGDEPIYSEYRVTNPDADTSYRIAIRGQNPGDNYCSCPDFAVNTLGTCKHIEFTLGKLERRRGGKKAFREGFRAPYSEVYLRYGAKREVCFLRGQDCPTELADYAKKFFDANGVLKQAAYRRFHTFLRNRPGNGHELRCYEDAVQFVAQVRDDEKRRKLLDKQFPRGASRTRFRGLLKVDLYPYQREGALFAARTGRCLIADDMGLGKTVQAIAAVEILARTAGVERILVVAPTSLKHQWRQEIERFSKRTVEVVEGLPVKRREKYRTDTFYKIVNYDVIHRDEQFIAEWEPDAIILDEAQRIKNWKTRRAQSVKKLQSQYAMVLTGTPLENRLEELHSIVEFADRFRLGPLFRFLSEHQHLDDVGKVVGYRNLSQIRETLDPVLIRRTKNEVLKQLPARVDQHHFVPMTEEQWKLHEENGETVARIVAKWRRLGFLSEKDQRVLMIALQNMRMACNSTYLLDKRTDHGVKADEVAVLLEEILEEPDTKVVLFSQWIGTHELIVDRLDSCKCNHVFFHGSLDSQKRGKLLKQFKEDPSCRIFLSTDAGGVGLNLQQASVVINMDQPWNPAVLEQRIGRVHRLGQHRNVRVVHFVSQGTIEHGMLDVLAFKKSMFSGVLDGGEDEVFLGKTKLKQFMETVDRVSGNIPESMPRQEEMPITEGALSEENAVEETVASEGGRLLRESEVTSAGEWDEWLSKGVSLLGELGKALGSAESAAASGKTESLASRLLDRDEKTGETFLKLPLPEPETLKKLSNALGAFGELLQGKSKSR